MTPSIPPPPLHGAAVVPRGWLTRHWKWLVPVMVLVATALLAGFVALVFGLVAGSMKSTGAYQQAMALAGQDPLVRSRLGSPVEAGRFITGSFRESGGSGRADMAIPVHGPNGEATLYLDAEKSLGAWTLNHLVIEFAPRGDRHDLLPAPVRPD